MTEIKAIKLIKIITILPILFGSILLVDYFLPPVFRNSIVVSSQTYESGGFKVFSSKSRVFILKTNGQKLFVNDLTFYAVDKGDSIKVLSTPILLYPKKIFYFNKEQSAVHSSTLDYSIFNGSLILPFGLLLLSILTLISKKDISDVGAKGTFSFLIFIYLLIKVL